MSNASIASQGRSGNTEPNPFEQDIGRLILRAPESFKETLRRASMQPGEHNNTNDGDLRNNGKEVDTDDINELELQTVNSPKKETMTDGSGDNQTLLIDAGEDDEKFQTSEN
eukprot:CAMPEP_0202733134 /NCGR_PEP_ID=MMETSP1385-20130828/188014_1 /ASSEMBLY_ACC=CAM_ASM_000861 /TAXON_ID=933848 /ORGANISM="Elphidium margaritaceum" /LENGTH=111 /DNA_ID=CAMNT_0049399461 /DNA_START=457 /DNA_END=792 /DNA_ORIENTATION=+